MPEKYMIKENPFIEMLGLYTIPVTSKEGYNGLVFDGDSLVGYTRKSEDSTIITIEQDNTNIWIRDNNNGCFEGHIEITKKKKTIRIDYIYLEEQKLTSLTDNDKRVLELSSEGIIAINDIENITNYRLEDQNSNRNLSLEELKNIKDSMDYFYDLMPSFFTNIMRQYKKTFGKVLPTYKTKAKKQPK